ncbi:hypothetical protein [Luteipulveratus halotolerans]|uniref:hypothetical protein n=1 Tax=Luteipulveratus halotolerans TaxID=1631356 RepID=UPI0012F94FAD|nr:hypothetical protein [Luteipulveratus halotolerans]
MSDAEPDPSERTRTTLRPVRRAPNFAQFLITGTVVGVLLGLWVGSRDGSGGYSDTTAMGFFAVIFGGLGALLAGAIAVLIDKRSLR